MNLERFKSAQEFSYQDALEEIKRGHKESHWMWFMFPQIIGLGESDTSDYYAIKSIEEAESYLNDEYLSHNLKEITNALLSLDNNDAISIFGSIDSLKLKSSMTLFDYVSDDEIFSEVLEKFYNGEKCTRTLEILRVLGNRLVK